MLLYSILDGNAQLVETNGNPLFVNKEWIVLREGNANMKEATITCIYKAESHVVANRILKKLGKYVKNDYIDIALIELSITREMKKGIGEA